MKLFPDIRERLEKATPGPWNAFKYPDVKSHTVSAKESVASKIKNSEDADFIAHSPTDIARLLKAVDLAVEAFNKFDGICDREESYDEHCRENGGRLTSPIREIKSCLNALKNHILAQLKELSEQRRYHEKVSKSR